MKFTYQSYINNIKFATSLGYTISSFSNMHDDTLLKLYIRHDVDISLESAEKLAKIEYDNGIRSTYYILLTSDFYNIFNTDSIALLKKISSYGHDIGIHFDCLKYNIKTLEDLQKYIDFEKEVYEVMLNIPIKSFSFHRPLPEYVNKNIEIDDLIYTYAPAFVSESEYISDSRMKWIKDFRVVAKENKETNKNIQLLTHPIWYKDIEENLADICVKEIKQGMTEKFKAFNYQIKNFGEIVSEEEFLFLKEGNES